MYLRHICPFFQGTQMGTSNRLAFCSCQRNWKLASFMTTRLLNDFKSMFNKYLFKIFKKHLPSVFCTCNHFTETMHTYLLVINCPSLEVPEYGSISTVETEYQTRVNYSCNMGYELNTTEISKVCQSDGQWMPDETVSCQSMLTFIK